MSDLAALDKLKELARRDPEVWFTTFARIKDKEGKIVRPKANVLQRRMFAYYRECGLTGQPCLMVVLKPRQKGASTAAQAIIYHHQRRNEGLNGALMGDIAGTSDKVFDIYRRYAENDRFPWGDSKFAGLTDKQNGTDLIELPSGSTYGKETAGSKNAGRGGTVQVASLTEPAFYDTDGKTDPTLAFLNSFNDASPVSLGIADSTPNGPKGWFYKKCRDKTKANRWKLIFAAWFEFEDSVKPFVSEEEKREFVDGLLDHERDELRRFSPATLENMADPTKACGPITLEHLNWRRDTITNKCDGDVDKFRQEYPSDPMECFLKSARPRFDMAVLEMMKKAAEGVRPETVGNFAVQKTGQVSWSPDPQGATKIFEPPRYECSYLVSADTMTGEDQVATGETADPDWHDIQVWRTEYFDEGLQMTLKRKLVARHVSRLPVDLAAEEAFGLSVHYGGCMIVPEVNNSGLAFVKELIRLGANVYRRRRMDTTTNRVEEQFGWATNVSTRKTIIDTLAKLVRERDLDIPDVEVIEQMMVFITNRSGKPEAMPGEHDDAVLSAAIAQENMMAATKRTVPKRRAWTPDRLARNPSLGMSDGFVRSRYVTSR